MTALLKESTIEKRVTQYAKSHGWLSYKWHTTHQKGLPDRLFLKQGNILMVEFKAQGAKPTKLQCHTHQQLIEQGFNVHVIDNIEQGKQLLDTSDVK
ncbi:hypothetical protein [Cysteiniphilum halobium]|uniref:hypothetical protein n=1 Tax=Cysteiniphilum halobium TaxID=2219059 RepID=UPI003F87E560